MGEKDKGEIHIGGGQHLMVKTSQVVHLNDEIKLFTSKGHVASLNVEIKADFEKIPAKYHSTFIHMLTARYGGVVNIHSNTDPFSDPTPKTKKWYQFWKSK